MLSHTHKDAGALTDKTPPAAHQVREKLRATRRRDGLGIHADGPGRKRARAPSGIFASVCAVLVQFSLSLHACMTVCLSVSVCERLRVCVCLGVRASLCTSRVWICHSHRTFPPRSVSCAQSRVSSCCESVCCLGPSRASSLPLSCATSGSGKCV